LHRNERLIALLRSMLDRPGNAFTLGGFAERFGAARSTISEDLALIRRTLEETGGGTIETLPGATGGARFLPLVGKQELAGRLDRLCEELADPSRIIPGGFLYMTDVIFSPTWASWIGEIFATVFYEMRPGYVVTIETKGIPLALMTARALGTPLVIVRRESRVTEGSTVSINYVSASSQRIQRMCLPRRALPSGSRALVIDDWCRTTSPCSGWGRSTRRRRSCGSNPETFSRAAPAAGRLVGKVAGRNWQPGVECDPTPVVDVCQSMGRCAR